MQVPSSPLDIASALRLKAQELGFDLCGFARALPPARGELFSDWLREGKAGTMTYLNRTEAKRRNPELVLPGVKTVISLGKSYFAGRLPEELRADPSRGVIASYAWQQDYHDALATKLQALGEFLEQCASGVTWKSFVDSGPVLERDFGETAGLGFIGKNTLLIHPRMGSKFFLAEIFTTLDIPVENTKPMPSCGSCTRCLEVCPTHALPSAHVLDSTRCISYLTIEFRGVIERELREKIGNHIFGCDDCQECCPWVNRAANESHDKIHDVEIERSAPKLETLAKLSESEFKTRFVGTPVMRARYEGFLRNVAIAIGNWRREEALVALEPLLKHESVLVRRHAAWALTRIPGETARRKRNEMSCHDASAEVRQEAAG